MDDILSAALGQSGLNFSFLEDQDDKPSSSGSQQQQQQQHAVSTTGNILASSNISTLPTDTDSIFKDDTEDVTELLNLLDDTEQDRKNLGASASTTGSISKNSKDDVLDYLLKFQSDDDSAPSSPVQPSPLSILSASLTEHNNSKRTTALVRSSTKADLDSRKLISITSKFPKINSNQPAYINVKTANNKIAKLTFPNKGNIVQRLAANNNNKSTLSVKTTTLSSPAPAKQIVIRTTPNDKSKETILTQKTNSTSVKTSINKSGDPSKMLSEDDKKKLSIQHVLASPNLTYREKQFLMKKALSANIKPTHPTLSSTVK